MLQVAAVDKSFGDLQVLRGIDLTVAEHEVVCLIGASGSGKSTLLRCVNLLEPIDAGSIVVAGEEITRRGVDVDRVRRGVANRVCFLDAGRILEHGSPEQIFGAPREERTRQFLQRIVAAGRL